MSEAKRPYTWFDRESPGTELVRLRWKKLSKDARSAIMSAVARARWDKEKAKEKEKKAEE